MSLILAMPRYYAPRPSRSDKCVHYQEPLFFKHRSKIIALSSYKSHFGGRRPQGNRVSFPSRVLVQMSQLSHLEPFLYIITRLFSAGCHLRLSTSQTHFLLLSFAISACNRTSTCWHPQSNTTPWRQYKSLCSSTFSLQLLLEATPRLQVVLAFPEWLATLIIIQHKKFGRARKKFLNFVMCVRDCVSSSKKIGPRLSHGVRRAELHSKKHAKRPCQEKKI